MYKIIYCVIVMFSLTGCESDTDIVKNSVFTYIDYENNAQSYDASYTIKQAFDHRDVCNDIKWSTFQDDRKRTIIQNECTFDGFLNYFPNWLEGRKNLELNKINNDYEKLTILKNKLTKVNVKLEEYQPIVDNKKNDLEAYMAIFSKLSRLKSDRSYLQNAIKNKEKQFPNGLEFQQEQIELKYERPYIPESAKETYQWILNNDKNPIYIYNGMYVKFTSGQVLVCDYPLFDSLKRIYSNESIGAYSDLIKSARYWVQKVNSYGNYEQEKNANYYQDVLNDYDVKHAGGIGTRLSCKISSMN